MFNYIERAPANTQIFINEVHFQGDSHIISFSYVPSMDRILHQGISGSGIKAVLC